MEPSQSSVDFNKSLDASSAQLDVEKLAKKGIRKVRALNKSTMLKLINEAVQRIISTKTNLLTEQEKENILKQSKNELKRLIDEQKSVKDKAELAEQDKNELVKEVMNLNDQIRVMQNVHQEETSKRFDEGVKSQESLIDGLRGELEIYKAKEEEVKARYESDMQERYDAGIKSQEVVIENLRKDLETAKQIIEENKGGVSEELANKLNSLADSHQASINELKEEIKQLKQSTDQQVKMEIEKEYERKVDEAVKAKDVEIETLNTQLEDQKAEVEKWSTKFESIKSLFS